MQVCQGDFRDSRFLRAISADGSQPRLNARACAEVASEDISASLDGINHVFPDDPRPRSTPEVHSGIGIQSLSLVNWLLDGAEGVKNDPDFVVREIFAADCGVRAIEDISDAPRSNKNR